MGLRDVPEDLLQRRREAGEVGADEIRRVHFDRPLSVQNFTFSSKPTFPTSFKDRRYLRLVLENLLTLDSFAAFVLFAPRVSCVATARSKSNKEEEDEDSQLS